MVLVKSIQVLPQQSETCAPTALSQMTGICPCMDVDSYLSSWLNSSMLSGAGMAVLKVPYFVDTESTCFGVREKFQPDMANSLMQRIAVKTLRADARRRRSGIQEPGNPPVCPPPEPAG